MPFKMVTGLTKDGTVKLEEFKVKMEQKISVEATEVYDSLHFKCKVRESGNLDIQIYPKAVADVMSVPCTAVTQFVCLLL